MFIFVVKLFYLRLNVVVFKKVKIKLGNVVMVFDNVYRYELRIVSLFG